MSEILKTLTPILLTLIISGIGYIYIQVNKIENKQLDSIQYIVVINSLVEDNNDQEKRIRYLESEYLRHIHKCGTKQ